MTRQKLASLLAKAEGGKTQARINDIRQILKLLVHMDAAYVLKGETSPLDVLMAESDSLVAQIKSTPAKKQKKK